jgi:hypothetical protein
MAAHRAASALRVFSAYAFQNRPILINRILQIHVRIHAPQMPPNLHGVAHIEFKRLYRLQQARICRGAVEAGHSASYFYIGKDPAFGFGTAMPFGLNARAQNA